ncbi:MAG: SoxR reducing system RseC family protein [Candidatus Saccharimonadaceae bacterium]
MIEHEGIIDNINGNQFTIRILQSTACSECHAKNACMAADTKEKMVDVIDASGQFNLHERVLLFGKASIGYKAVLWAFVLPLILLMVVIFTATSMWHVGELKVAFMALIALVPYYAFLYIIRHKMGEKLAFTIKKLN